MANVISFFRNNTHFLFIGLICICLWGLNARNAQLTATNERLEKLANSKDQQINDLRQKNDSLADSVTELVRTLREGNELQAVAVEQKNKAEVVNRELQNDIRQYLRDDKGAASPVPDGAVERLRRAEAAAGGVPDDKNTLHPAIPATDE
ncbi:Rz lytic protein [Enterobacterales bacterium CwR94]|nr:Rz lytic protein [Enterobacterales bacterium CwR94]